MRDGERPGARGGVLGAAAAAAAEAGGGPLAGSRAAASGAAVFFPSFLRLSSPPSSSSSSPKPGEEACSQSLAAPVLLGSLLPGLVRRVIGLRDFLCAFFFFFFFFFSPSLFPFPFLPPSPVAHRMLGSGWILSFIFGGAARRGKGARG